MPTNSRRNYVRSIATVIASTRSNFTRPGTNCSRLRVRAGLHSSPWAEPKPGAHVARAAGTYMLGQIESGVYCPIAMTYGSVPTLRHAPQSLQNGCREFFRATTIVRFRPARLKSAALIGMGMTENQGGSDLRTNTTRAEPSGDGKFPPVWPQMVHVGADVRRFSCPRTVAERLELLSDAALDAGGRTQRHPDNSAERQARQSLERLERGRISWRLCAARRRRGARHSDHHRDGQLYAARLLHRFFRV